MSKVIYWYQFKPEYLSGIFGKTVFHREIGPYIQARLKQEYDLRSQVDNTMAQGESQVDTGKALDRLIFLSDGVFAIAITLLVLEINVPEIPSALQEAQLSGMLFHLWKPIVTYALSYIIVGVYWTSHQRIFQYIKRADNVLIWLNIFFLMTVAFLPIPTKVLGLYGDHQPAVIFYVCSLMIAGLIIIALWWYATSEYPLVDKQLDPALIGHHMQRALIAPLIFLLSIAISFLNTSLAELSLILIGVVIFVHELLYRHRLRSQRQEKGPLKPEEEEEHVSHP